MFYELHFLLYACNSWVNALVQKAPKTMVVYFAARVKVGLSTLKPLKKTVYFIYKIVSNGNFFVFLWSSETTFKFFPIRSSTAIE